MNFRRVISWMVMLGGIGYLLAVNNIDYAVFAVIMVASMFHGEKL